MRKVITKLYKFDELTDEAKERARDWYRRANESDNYTLEEMMDSLKALCKSSGVKLKDWSVGPYSPSYITVDIGDANEITGARALAWFENNVLAPVRITREQYLKKRKDYFGYGDGYRIGCVEPCPFTGVCYDEDLLDALRKALKDGDTLEEAFNGLGEAIRKMNEAEIEYLNEDAQVDDAIMANEYEFTEDGSIS